ncbi:MAG: hypothetical protein GY820_06245, partial [Gammaproteobacteria bacterium]|nr:hypothetical protein [Gammaproteobacteria bacterium]
QITRWKDELDKGNYGTILSKGERGAVIGAPFFKKYYVELETGWNPTEDKFDPNQMFAMFAFPKDHCNV